MFFPVWTKDLFQRSSWQGTTWGFIKLTTEPIPSIPSNIYDSAPQRCINGDLRPNFIRRTITFIARKKVVVNHNYDKW
jgi:hypothetical protein